MSFRIAVVGGGPAGLTAASCAARAGAEVTVFERMKRPGIKLLAAGGGRGNFTNVLSADCMAGRGYFGARNFVKFALKEFPPEKLREFFERHGVPSHAEDGFHYFPDSEKSEDLLKALLDDCDQCGVKIRCGSRVERLLIDDAAITGIAVVGEELRFDRVILAGGGRSCPTLGSDGSAYTLAESAGHPVKTPLPALGALKTGEAWPGTLAGVALDDCELWLKGEKPEPGTVLFTHGGISGPAVLDWTGRVNRRCLEAGNAAVFLRFRRNCPRDFWQSELAAARQSSGAESIKTFLSRHFPRSLTLAALRHLEIEPECRLAEFSKVKRDALTGFLGGAELTVTGSDGFDRAMTTDGGVELAGVNPRTLGSRTVKGLFFAGEVLDVNGRCGGYNLQWAFSSGALAGSAAGTA